MIEKMKRLSLLIHAHDRNDFLTRLQSLGVVHVDTAKDLQKLEILLLKENISKLQREKSFLSALAVEAKTSFHQEELKGDMDELQVQLEESRGILEELKGRLEKTLREIGQLEAWGEFDPAQMKALLASGVVFRYFQISASDWEKLDKADLNYEVINTVGSTVYVAVILRTGETLPSLPGLEAPVPPEGLTSLRQLAAQLESEIAKKKKSILGFARYLDVMEKELETLQDRLSYSVVNNSMEETAHGRVLVTTGWYPVKSEPEVLRFLEEQKVAYITEEPGHHDRPPIKLKNSAPVKLFEPVMKIFSLPAYEELDTTIFLAPFFALFFGLCMADIGYGAIMLVATLFASFKLKGDMKPLARLGVVFSLMTIVGGFLVGDMFGIHILPHELSFFYGFHTHEQLEAMAKELGKPWDANQQKMAFAMFLGVLQITLAYILRSINGFRNYGWQGGLKGLGLLLMIDGLVLFLCANYVGPGLVIGPMPVGQWIFLIPDVVNVTLYAVIAGLVLLFLFNGVEHHLKVWLRPFVGLWELFEFISSVPGYILSYLRLFAIGLAGGLLGASFNDIASKVGGVTDGHGTILTIAFMVLILLLGHTINLLLALIASFVHPIRLTFVEFYNCLGFKGGGSEYRPFRYSPKKENI